MSVAMPVAVIVAMTIVVAVSMAIAVVIIVFVLSVVVAVIVLIFCPIFVAAELLVPAAVPAPISMLSAHRQRSTIAEVRIEVVIHISLEANRPVKPGSCTNKDAAREPLRTVITERRARIWSVVEIAVRARGSHANPDSDVDLSFCL